MKPRPSLLLVASALFTGLLLSGCWTLSLRPLFSDDTLTYDERLLGTWENDDATATFTQASDGKYRIQYTEDNRTSALEAGLLKLGEERYLDVYPPFQEHSDVTDVHRIPAHSFWKVSLEGNKLRLIPLDYDWLHALLEREPKAIRATRVDKDLILLTASSVELQEFVRRHGEQAFKATEDNVWQRKPAPVKKD